MIRKTPINASVLTAHEAQRPPPGYLSTLLAVDSSGHHRCRGTKAAKLNGLRDGVAVIGISLDSLGPEHHDRLCGIQGCWGKALTGIEDG